MRMADFFSKSKNREVVPPITSWANMTTFYSLLIFLIAIPFVLIVALVWLSGVLGFSAWIFLGFALICLYIGWRIYRHWGRIKQNLASQGREMHEMMKEAAAQGKDVEISMLNGLVTLRYRGNDTLPPGLPQSRTLALAAPAQVEAEPEAFLPPSRVREELSEFIRLRDSGVISPEEFERVKAGLLQKMSA